MNDPTPIPDYAHAARAAARRLENRVVVDGALCAALTRESFDVENPADLSIVSCVPR